MSRVCSITGKKAMVGNNVSHSQRKSKRTFGINLIKKRFFIPDENEWITIKLTASALKTINRKGIVSVLKEARANGMVLR
jgi:large subunit ribosomal protein L28|tara:strand:+ start:193 stop:432 length:240 start_codon:yes stop_codon:yes gene_type:complete